MISPFWFSAGLIIIFKLTAYDIFKFEPLPIFVVWVIMGLWYRDKFTHQFDEDLKLLRGENDYE